MKKGSPPLSEARPLVRERLTALTPKDPHCSPKLQEESNLLPPITTNVALHETEI